MMNLLPNEYWDYKFSDLVRGFAVTFQSDEKTPHFIKIPGIGDCIPTRSARAAIVAAVKAIGLPPGSRIGVPLYCCPVVFKAIELARCTARFIDVEFGTYCISPEDLYKKRSQIDAVIPVHMFGSVCDMPKINDAAEGKPIIEDCAQSIGSKLDGRMAGSFGTMAAFSFRSGKYLSVGEGGALFASDPSLHSRIIKIISEMPSASRSEERIHVAKTYLRSTLRSKVFWGWAGYPLWAVYNRKVEYSSKTPIVLKKIFRSDLALTSRRLRDLDSAIKSQRASAEFYLENLHADPEMLCFESPNTFYNRYLFPILFHSAEQRESMAAYLFAREIDTAKPYRDIAEIAERYYGYKGDCPTAEEIASRVLVIPNNFSLTKGDVQRIATNFNAGWNDIGRAAVKTIRNASVGI